MKGAGNCTMKSVTCQALQGLVLKYLCSYRLNFYGPEICSRYMYSIFKATYYLLLKMNVLTYHVIVACS